MTVPIAEMVRIGRRPAAVFGPFPAFHDEFGVEGQRCYLEAMKAQMAGLGVAIEEVTFFVGIKDTHVVVLWGPLGQPQYDQLGKIELVINGWVGLARITQGVFRLVT